MDFPSVWNIVSVYGLFGWVLFEYCSKLDWIIRWLFKFNVTGQRFGYFA